MSNTRPSDRELIKSEMTDPIVSVCMITYNHEAYIAQAIESVLMQKTDFPFEIVIGEDCSLDQTRTIVQDYIERYPSRIRAQFPEQNQGMLPNFGATLNSCRGKYIALLEGDDYWTDPLKLKKQVEYLEKHKDCSMVFHNTAVYLDGIGLTGEVSQPLKLKEKYDLRDLLVENFIPTLSVMVRNGLVETLPDWYYELPIGDWPFHILHAMQGLVGYINETMAAYRIHSHGAFSKLDAVQRIKTRLDVLDSLRFHLHLDKYPEYQLGLARVYLKLSAVYSDTDHFKIGKQYLWKSIHTKAISNLTVGQLAMLIKYYLPRLYKFIKQMTGGKVDFRRKFV